jgi:hypothetical protein
VKAWEQLAVQKKHKKDIVESDRLLVKYNDDKFYTVDKFSDLVMGDNFARKDDGKRTKDNDHNYKMM